MGQDDDSDVMADKKRRFREKDQQLDDLSLKDLSQVLDSSESAKQIHFEELLQRLTLKTILRGFTPYEMRLLYLHAVEGRSYEEIAQDVNEDVEVASYHLEKIYKTIRVRVQAIYGKKDLFK